MNEIKTDLFPENLRAARNDRGMQEKGMSQDSHAGEMKTESEYKDTMTPTEPLPETERPRKDGPGGE